VEGKTGFIGEDIRFHLELYMDAPKHPNAWGALISMLVKRKIIFGTGKYRQMHDKRSHARTSQIYTCH
jgi:hypothetical protein